MKRSDEIRQLKAEKLAKMRGLSDAAKGRSMTAEERSQYDALKGDVESLNSELEGAIMMEAEERAQAERDAEQREKNRRPNQGNGGEEGEKAKIKQNYRLLRAINLVASGKPLDGVELEMHQEAEREARAANVTASGNLQVPSMLSRSFGRQTEQRDMTAGTTTAGGYTVQTDIGDLIPILEPKLLTRTLGATVLTGLTGNIDFPRGNADASATWEGENDANAETSPTFDRLQLSPNRLGAFTDISKQLMVQSSIDVENYVRQRLNFAIAKAVDLAAINGSGSSPEPRGILNTSGIGDVAGGTNGANPDWSDIVDLETQVAIDNADMGRLAYLTTPGVRGYLKQTIIDSGSGRFIWPVNATELNGYNAQVSTQVPSTLTKGSSSGVCHAIIFGNWQELLIGQWAGIDLVVDPYTGAKNSLVTLVVNSWWDVAIRHAASFAAMKDALIS